MASLNSHSSHERPVPSGAGVWVGPCGLAFSDYCPTPADFGEPRTGLSPRAPRIRPEGGSPQGYCRPSGGVEAPQGASPGLSGHAWVCMCGGLLFSLSLRDTTAPSGGEGVSSWNLSTTSVS